MFCWTAIVLVNTSICFNDNEQKVNYNVGIFINIFLQFNQVWSQITEIVRLQFDILEERTVHYLSNSVIIYSTYVQREM